MSVLCCCGSLCVFVLSTYRMFVCLCTANGSCCVNNTWCTDSSSSPVFSAVQCSIPVCKSVAPLLLVGVPRDGHSQETLSGTWRGCTSVDHQIFRCRPISLSITIHVIPVLNREVVIDENISNQLELSTLKGHRVYPRPNKLST